MESEGAEVRRGLYIGSLAAASDEEWLAARGITHILTVAWGIAPFWPEVKLPPPLSFPQQLIADHDDHE
jgi:hypothetical protein